MIKIVGLNQERQFEWMKLRRKYSAITGMFDIPIMIVVWYLGYKTTFGILLIIFILGDIAHYRDMKKMANKVGIEEV
ncbi:hypothetical protein LCGC14_3110510 [marine sediment metagenome]|uniref:Uncharacterized protein n=1 Tax=marine sediment metagenome TaxID=412755 RepID=A0A0F8YV71_9ZZZZ